MVPKSRHKENDILTAPKKKESKNWNDFQVYSKVSDQTISTTWIITEKLVNNGRIVKTMLSSTGV